MIFKVLSPIVFCVMDNYVRVDHLCFPQAKLHVTNKGQVFEKRTYNSVSVIFIPELLLNIISCHGFLRNTKSAVILSCCSKLSDYYLKTFVLRETIQIPLRICVYMWNKESMHITYIKIIKSIPYDANTLKCITICSHFLIVFVSTYYNDKGDAFRYIFGKYINPYMKEIYHIVLIQEWKLNLDTSSYLNKLDKKKDIHQIKNKLIGTIAKHFAKIYYWRNEIVSFSGYCVACIR